MRFSSRETVLRCAAQAPRAISAGFSPTSRNAPQHAPLFPIELPMLQPPIFPPLFGPFQTLLFPFPPHVRRVALSL